MSATRLAPHRARLFALRALAVMRWPTAPKRALPSFIIIGAQKSATSSLYRQLVEFPGIEPAMRKEVHFFENDRVHRLGLGYYRAHFPLRRRLRRSDGTQALTGEATPTYLMSPVAADRIARALPDCRFVVVLREPVERAISHYHHRRQAGKDGRGIDRALLESLQAARSASIDPYDDTLGPDSYVEWGRYAKFLSVWYALVGEERMIVVGMDELIGNEPATLPLIAEFIGAGEVPTSAVLPHLNQGDGEIRPTDDVEAQLRLFFEGPNQDLRELLHAHQPQRALPGWLRATDRWPTNTVR